MRALAIYLAAGLIIGALAALLLFRGAKDFGEDLARAQEQRLQTWEQELLK